MSVRKPNNQDFVRVHPSEDYRLTAAAAVRNARNCRSGRRAQDNSAIAYRQSAYVFWCSPTLIRRG